MGVFEMLEAVESLTSASYSEPYTSGEAWDIEGHRIVIDPESIGETWYSHPDGSIGNPACLGSSESTVWVRDPSTNDETWRICPEHGESCEDGAYTSQCEYPDCGWTNYYLGYGAHPLEVGGAIPEPVTAANPQGINAYDKGKSFEEATGGVNRDYHGRFSPEGGSNRSERRKRRSNSIFRRKKEREDKEAKKSDSAANKAKREKEKATKDAQREKLAQLSLAIAQAVAAGNRIEAAELRVQRAQLMLQWADTPTEKLNAQTALTNAQATLARARRSKAKASTTQTRTRARATTPKKDPIGDFYDANGRYPNEDELKELGY